MSTSLEPKKVILEAFAALNRSNEEASVHRRLLRTFLPEPDTLPLPSLSVYSLELSRD
jgi:hypothetical protein